MREKPFTHRPVDGVMECTSCHDPHGRPGKESLKLTRAGELPCLSCHAEKRGPFVFEHPTGLTATPRRTARRCHEPHGSSNPKQLMRARGRPALPRVPLDDHGGDARLAAAVVPQPLARRAIATARRATWRSTDRTSRRSS